MIVSTRLHLHTPHRRHRIDYLGAALLSGGVGALILLATWGGTEYAWGSNEIVGLGIVGVVLLAAFVWQERRAAEPILPLQLFRSRIFSVANAMGFTIGMAMFGAIIFIPLFLQIVYGVSAQSSGLRTIPLMAGLLVTAVLSGRAISRIGRYRPFPIAGTAVLVVGMFLLSLLGVDTPPWVASAYMVVVGVGLGLVMQVLVLAVQNDARPQEIGVATASATFFRSMGGAFGVALFGTIFATRLSDQLAGLPRRVTARLGSGVQLDPTQIDQLPPRIHDEVLHAFAHSLSGVFLFGMVLCARAVRPLVVPQGEAAPDDGRPRGRGRAARTPAGQFAWESPEQLTQRRAGGVEAAHPVHAAARRRRGRAEEDARQRRRVRRDSRDGTGEELRQGRRAAVDVAADVVRVVALHRRRAERRAREDPLAEAGREALDLRLDPLRHVDARAVRDVAVRPGRVPPGRRARRVEEALLGEQHERPLRDLPAPRRRLRRRDLLQRRSEVDGPGACAFLRPPGDRPVERPVELEHARPVAVALQPAAVARGEAVAGQVEQAARRHVEEHETGSPSSASDSTRRPVSISPPSERR